MVGCFVLIVAIVLRHNGTLSPRHTSHFIRYDNIPLYGRSLLMKVRLEAAELYMYDIDLESDLPSARRHQRTHHSSCRNGKRVAR